jgi:hypothetical protein
MVKERDGWLSSGMDGYGEGWMAKIAGCMVKERAGWLSRGTDG